MFTSPWLKSVGALNMLKLKFVAPMLEQIEAPTVSLCKHLIWLSLDLTKRYCYGLNSFWHGCNEIKILGPQSIDYVCHRVTTQTPIRVSFHNKWMTNHTNFYFHNHCTNVWYITHNLYVYPATYVLNNKCYII